MRLYYGKELRGAIYNAAKIVCTYLNQEFDVKSVLCQGYEDRVENQTDRTNTIYGITDTAYDTEDMHDLYTSLRGGYFGTTEYACGCMGGKSLFTTLTDPMILTQWGEYISEYESNIGRVRTKVNQKYNDIGATSEEKHAAVVALIKQEFHLAQLKKRYEYIQAKYEGSDPIDATIIFGGMAAGNYYTSSRDSKYHILVLSAEGTFNKNASSWQSIGQIAVSDEFVLSGKFKRNNVTSDEEIECGFAIETDGSSQGDILLKLTFDRDLEYNVLFSIDTEGAFPGGFAEVSNLLYEYTFCFGGGNGGAYYINVDTTSVYTPPISTGKYTTATVPRKTIQTEEPWMYYNNYIKNTITDSVYRVFPHGYNDE